MRIQQLQHACRVLLAWKWTSIRGVLRQEQCPTFWHIKKETVSPLNCLHLCGKHAAERQWCEKIRGSPSNGARLPSLTVLLLLSLQGARGLEVVKNQLDLLSQLSHAGPPASVRQAAQQFVLLQPIARLAANKVSSTSGSDAVVRAGFVGAQKPPGPDQQQT